MDKLSLNRIETLHPKIRSEVKEAFLYINKKILGYGVRLRLTSCYRSINHQNYLYSFGRTKFYDKGHRVGKVTNARGGMSYHNYGLAFDIATLLDEDRNGIFEKASWDIYADFDKDMKSDWIEIANHFIEKGFEWGGNWSRFKDYPHFQKTFNYDVRELRKLWKEGKTFTENGIEYPHLERALYW